MGSRSGASLFVFQQLTSCYPAKKLKAGPAFSCIACVGGAITLKNSRARGLLGQLTRTEIAWDQSLIKTVLVKVGAATALVKSSISSDRISSIRSRRSIISWSSSSRSVLWHLNCSRNSGVKSVKLENLFHDSNKRMLHGQKHARVRCLSPFLRLCCRAFLYPCRRERVEQASTSLTHKTNRSNEAGGCLVEDLVKTTLNTAGHLWMC